MKQIALLTKSGFFILALGCSLGSLAQPQDFNSDISEKLDKAAERLGLTPEQTDRFFETVPRQMAEKRAQKKKFGDAKRTLYESHRAEMIEILNPDQLLMLDGMIKRRQMKHFKKGRREDL